MQPFPSVTVTVYPPAGTLLIDEVVAPPGAQEYVKVPVPPVALTDADPFEAPQLDAVVAVVRLMAEGSVMDTD